MTASNLNARIEEILIQVWKHGQSRRSLISLAKLTNSMQSLVMAYTRASVKDSVEKYLDMSALAPELVPLDGTKVDLWIDKPTYRQPHRICDCHYDGRWLAPTGAGTHYPVDGEVVGWYPVIRVVKRPTAPEATKIVHGADFGVVEFLRRVFRRG